MIAAQGILTARGGLVSHAAVVARGWGKPAVVGAESVRISAAELHRRRRDRVNEGDVISIDGTTGRGRARRGRARRIGTRPPSSRSILGWADKVRKGQLAVRANADNGPDAANARRFGAEGIGLCRTEHMFLAEDRLPIVRRMILADDADEETAALEELREAQKQDFVAILEAMDGLPVTVRLLDPPLHEFLPSTEELEIKKATEGLSAEEEKLLGRGRGLARVQPHARHPGRAPRGDQARAVRHAGAGPDAGGRRAGGRRRQAQGRGHDPPDRHPRGAGAGPVLGRGRHRHGDQGDCARSSTSPSAP